MPDAIETDGRATTPGRTLRLGLEFALLFAGIPLAFRFELVPLPMFALLWIAAAGCLGVLLLDRGFERRTLWNARGVAPAIRPVLARFLAGIVVLGGATWLLIPESLFGLVRERPRLWVAIMILYPLLSVYPQGVIYRSFLLHRYRPLFGSGAVMCLASGVAFGFAHVIFRNELAVLLTAIGGVAFAWTHLTTRSLLASSLEHALFGCFLFTIGLGRFFYYGAVQTGAG